MDFILMTEGDTPAGLTHEHRYRELVDEVLLAERVGFDAFGSSEQHVAIGTATVSAPEVLYPYLMALTSRLRFIHLVTLLPTRMNHALRVAERIATEDILSNGRVELVTGRGNTTLALRAFEVDPADNRSQWREVVGAAGENQLLLLFLERDHLLEELVEFLEDRAGNFIWRVRHGRNGCSRGAASCRSAGVRAG